MRSVYLLLGLTFTFSFMLNAQNNIGLQWQKNYGGSAGEIARSVQQTTDGGYIFAGTTVSIDSNIVGNHGLGDYWVVKTDPLGIVQWQKCYGGSSYEDAYCIKQTLDGGYIIAGTTFSNDGDVTGNHGATDIWIVKIDQLGILQWQKCYGGSNYEDIRSIQQTTDGGYIFAGWTDSWDGDITIHHGGDDVWVVKTDQNGQIQWQKCYGGTDNDGASGIQQTTDGGYIIIALTNSTNGDVTFNHGGDDYWLIKIDSFGLIQWQKCYGGSAEDDAYGGGQQTSDGGYILCGTSECNDGDVTGNHGGWDYWVVKTDHLGALQWQKCYGGTNFDEACSVQQTTGGGYILCGFSQSNDGDVTGNHGGQDYWVVKTNPSGTIIAERSCGGSSDEEALSCIQTINGTYVVAGYTTSTDGDVTNSHGSSDGWIVMLCNNDPLSISISDTSYCYSTMLTATAGFESYLWNTGATTQTIEVDSSDTYRVTATNLSGCPSENAITVPDHVQPYSGEQICMVTLDSVSGKNVIVIEKTLNVGTDSLHIYRLDNLSSLYKKIGALGINDPGIFTDNEAIPTQQSYQYKLSVKDTCGRESGLSAMHRTILLQANTGINHEVNLFWNPYEGFEYPTFEIYRSNNSRGDFILIANVPNTTYAFTDLTPPSGTNFYQVRVSKDSACVPAKSSYSHVSSNVITSSNIGIGENQEKTFTIHPNPASDQITVEISFATVTTQLSIMNPNGQEVITRQIAEPKTQIDISTLPNGVYFVRLTGERTVEVVKIIKE